MKKRVLNVLIVLIIFAFAGLKAQTTTKIGHIELDEIVSLLPESDSAIIVLEKETKEVESVYEEMLVYYNNLLNDYQKGLSGFSEIVRSAKEAGILDKQKRINDFEQYAAERLQLRNKELRMPIYKKVIDAVEAVANENGFTYIFDLSRSGVVYKSNDSYDISPLVKTRLGL